VEKKETITDPLIYVVDDDPDVREGLRDLLQSAGLNSQGFGSATELLANKLPDEVSCLVLDVRLPGLSGLDFQAELSAADIKIPIIFVTAHADIPMTVKAMKAGAAEFLTKPVREQDFLDAVRAAVDRDRLRREQDKETRDWRARFDELSGRERQVMALLTGGLMNKQIAGEIGVSEMTVKWYRRKLKEKFGARSLAGLLRIANALGITRKGPTLMNSRSAAVSRHSFESGHDRRRGGRS
jgi:FixJ family two-component response regulator